ncbi:MAG: FAD/NAD(P)-binding protein [Cellulosilyticaceae bacterium]
MVGAGIAGLSAAVYACQKGFEVEVYEMHTMQHICPTLQWEQFQPIQWAVHWQWYMST